MYESHIHNEAHLWATQIWMWHINGSRHTYKWVTSHIHNILQQTTDLKKETITHEQHKKTPTTNTHTNHKDKPTQTKHLQTPNIRTRPHVITNLPQRSASPMPPPPKTKQIATWNKPSLCNKPQRQRSHKETLLMWQTLMWQTPKTTLT